MAPSDRSASPRVLLKVSPQERASPLLVYGMTHVRVLERGTHLKEVLVRGGEVGDVSVSGEFR